MELDFEKYYRVRFTRYRSRCSGNIANLVGSRLKPREKPCGYVLNPTDMRSVSCYNSILRIPRQILADNCPSDYDGQPITVWQSEPGAAPEVFFGEVEKKTKTYYKLDDDWLENVRSTRKEDRQKFLDWFSYLYSYMVLLNSHGQLENGNQQEDAQDGGWVKVRKENRMVEVYYGSKLSGRFR